MMSSKCMAHNTFFLFNLKGYSTSEVLDNVGTTVV